MDHKELLPLIRKLEENKITYSLGGSGLLYYFKLIDSMNDWDITVDCSKELLLETIHGYDWTEQKSGDYPFASEYRISIETPNVDIIGNFALYSEEKVIELPVSIIEDHNWCGIKLSNLEVWYAAYELMGRKEKAELLLNHLKAHAEIADPHLINDLIKKLGITNNISIELGKLIL